ncbi:MAG: asparagine synthetase B, partial [Candidatus Kapaibacterium sp.]
MGAFSTTRAPLPITGEQAAAALDTIRHRGPDDSGVWWSADRSVLLGHRRLSIIDLSAAGHQPMTNEDGTIWIIFNGEIYNF